MNAAARRFCWYYNVKGRVRYQAAWEWQRSLRSERMVESGRGLPDVLILLEHQPVYTLGRASSEEHVKFDLENPPWDVHRIDRGGEVTYHGPGQVVGYPIVNLKNHKKDLRWYIRSLEQVIINTLAKYDVEGTRKEGLTGVWNGEQKLAAIGLGASKWVTMHGFALNVTEDLSGFDQIVPCGVKEKSVGCLNRFAPQATPGQVRKDLSDCFAEQFRLELIPFEGA
eukprot:CAMPEP_0184751696 /NCGR_PEP_ID=MMETSP0315-20130426/43183_1 /TAXON_ID=101924 /ORGANISM="Rhodosorus marinus, Strain UTEX LB 2760" /LENGTH=224 /DNA_ID=CAMNT_0027230979 /DNA_START=140 /DNA_END=814 /DNA_ORIENTATION=+